MKDINVGIIGVSGFTGLELVKILIAHKRFKLNYLANSTGETTLCVLHPCLSGVFDMEIQKADASLAADLCELVFLALPHKQSMRFARELLDLGVRVVDLSADFRLDLSTYEEWYAPHEAKECLKEAVYGLPELNKECIKKANLVANPGCYPTASLLPLLPFLDFLQDGEAIYIDAKSGVSGAGRAPKPHTTFANLNDNFFAYSPLAHRHSPEIEEKLSKACGKTFNVLFIPQLLPLTRGMLVNSFAKLSARIDDPVKILREYYKNEPFVRISQDPVQIKNVAGTNFCDIYADVKGTSLFLNSAIDNLLKGASGTAVVNANIMFNLEEDEGIPKLANT